MIGVRYREDTFEGKCDCCHEWWALTAEFWRVQSPGLSRCRACILEARRKARAAERRRKGLELVADAERTRYRTDTEYRMRKLALMAAYRDRNRDAIRAKAAEYRARNREALRLQARAYYAEAGDVIRMKARQRAAERAA